MSGFSDHGYWSLQTRTLAWLSDCLWCHCGHCHHMVDTGTVVHKTCLSSGSLLITVWLEHHHLHPRCPGRVGPVRCRQKTKWRPGVATRAGREGGREGGGQSQRTVQQSPPDRASTLELAGGSVTGLVLLLTSWAQGKNILSESMRSGGGKVLFSLLYSD